MLVTKREPDMLLKCTFLAGLSLSWSAPKTSRAVGSTARGCQRRPSWAARCFPTKVRKSIRLVIAGDKYKVTIGDKVDEGTVKRDPEAEPKQLDITGADGPKKAGRSWPFTS